MTFRGRKEEEKQVGKDEEGIRGGGCDCFCFLKSIFYKSSI